jgi:DNA-binding NtrC family response regulator
MTAPEATERGATLGTSLLCLIGPSSERATIGAQLTRMGLAAKQVSGLAEALSALSMEPFAACLVDLGDDLAGPSIRAIRAQHAELPIIGVVDPARPLLAAEAIHAGIGDLLPWPFSERDVAIVVANACDRISVNLPDRESAAGVLDEMVFAHSAPMRQVLDLARRAANGQGGVLLTGESGVGRSLVARAIHTLGPRAAQPFVGVDCSAASPDELERQLFGVVSERAGNGVKARQADRIGKTSAFYQARGGTLYLANVTEAPARVQAKLSRLTRDQEALLSGAGDVVDLDVRPIASVGLGLDAALADGRLRRDLYERLSHVRIDGPALRRRREDIPMLAVHLLQEAGDLNGGGSKQLTRAALALLSALPWPGNGRELRALMDTLAGSIDRPIIHLDDLLTHVRLDGIAARPDVAGSLRDAKARFERDWISAVLMKHQGRVGDAARALGIQRTNLYRKVRQLNVPRTLLSPRKSTE